MSPPKSEHLPTPMQSAQVLFPLGVWPCSVNQPLGKLVVLLASPYPWLAPAEIMSSSGVHYCVGQ